MNPPFYQIPKSCCKGVSHKSTSSFFPLFESYESTSFAIWQCGNTKNILNDSDDFCFWETKGLSGPNSDQHGALTLVALSYRACFEDLSDATHLRFYRDICHLRFVCFLRISRRRQVRFWLQPTYSICLSPRCQIRRSLPLTSLFLHLYSGEKHLLMDFWLVALVNASRFFAPLCCI